MNESIGQTAGKVYEHLQNHGPSDALSLKLRLGVKSSELLLAVGWLCREGKAVVRSENGDYKIELT